MSKETTLSSSTVDDISQGISGVDISDNIDICRPCTDSITTEICANCGKEGGSLKSCAACKLVKYCSRDCQIAHRAQHKKGCRRRAAELREEEVKRAAELHDEKLFKQPPSLYGDCPICFLQIPAFYLGSRYKSCCGKDICSGCIHAMQQLDGGIGLCPFCRTPTPESDKVIERLHKRVETNDPRAIFILGNHYSEGSHGLAQDHTKALELYHRAAELDNTQSYHNIGNAYFHGNGVEMNEKKAMHYWELSAMGGASPARHNLGALEQKRGNIDRAVKHYMIAVGGGDNLSLKTFHALYSNGKVTKEKYAKALRAYQQYVGEVKSDQRDAAAAFYGRYKYIE